MMIECTKKNYAELDRESRKNKKIGRRAAKEDTTEEVKVEHALDGELLVVVEQGLGGLGENISSCHG
jgi:hypothetical protein